MTDPLTESGRVEVALHVCSTTPAQPGGDAGPTVGDTGLSATVRLTGLPKDMQNAVESTTSSHFSIENGTWSCF